VISIVVLAPLARVARFTPTVVLPAFRCDPAHTRPLSVCETPQGDGQRRAEIAHVLCVLCDFAHSQSFHKAGRAEIAIVLGERSFRHDLCQKGVQRINDEYNRSRTSLFSEATDADLARTVRLALCANRNGCSRIKVWADNGTVRLSGPIRSILLRQLAIALSKQVVGVRRVVDDLEVDREEISTLKG